VRRKFDAIKKDERDIALEFEVWARIIRDSEGNDIQVFIKEDKKHGLRKDSSFYYNGYWEVMERDEIAKTVKSETSLGVKIVSLHDDKWRVTNKTITDKNDTLVSEQYIWKNGRLIKMIQDGLERIFIYGKTLQDSVKVIPSDEGFYFHQGYNNSVGKIPDEDDPMYIYFALDPYGRAFASENKYLSRNFLLKSYPDQENKPLALHRTPNITNSMYRYANEYPNISVTGYYNPIDEDIPQNWPRAVYPIDIEVNAFTNGRVAFDPDFNSKCVSDGCGKFRMNYDPKIIIKALEILQSVLRYNYTSLKWDRYCRTRNGIQGAYEHEAQHIFNAKGWIQAYSDMYMSKTLFDSKEQCEKELFMIETNLYILWLMWKNKEFMHDNPESPKYSGYKEEVACEY
jgi:hypothetical protein